MPSVYCIENLDGRHAVMWCVQCILDAWKSDRAERVVLADMLLDMPDTEPIECVLCGRVRPFGSETSANNGVLMAPLVGDDDGPICDECVDGHISRRMDRWDDISLAVEVP